MKYILIGSLLSVTAITVFLSGAASAATFTGYDENTSNPLIPLTAVTSPNSQAAFANFSARLNGTTLTTESFESFPTTTSIDGLVTTIAGTQATFSYKIKATPSLSASGTVQQAAASGINKGFTNSGTYPTDGVKGISINSSNNFSISFNKTLAAFGYFGTDLGDNSNVLTMNFFNGTALVKTTPIVPGVNSFNSSEYFFGFIADNSTEQFNKVVFSSSISSNGDAIGIDQIKISTPAQLTPVPEPSSILGTLFLGGSIVVMKRRQQQSKSSSKK